MTVPSDASTQRRTTALRRIMLVGSRTLTDALQRVFAEIEFTGELRAEEGYLAAIADAPAFRPDAVIGQLDGLADDASLVTNAFREITSDVRLVVLAWPEEMEAVRRIVDGGFDDYLIKPIDARALVRLLSGAQRRKPAPSPVAERDAEAALPERRIEIVEEAAGQMLRERTASPAPIRPDAPEPALSPQRYLTQPAPPPQVERDDETADLRAPDELPANAELGDVDLLEMLLSTQHSIVDRALELVRGQSGHRDIQWAQPEQRIPAGRVAATVSMGHKVHGRLHAGGGMDEHELAGWAAWLARWVAVQAELQELRRLAYTDELTGVWNRRYFNLSLDRLLDRARAERFRITVMVYDIDNFKGYNDRYGHAAGDDILRETARLMQSTVREHDIVARIGGDEFAVIFWDAEEPRRPNSRHPETVKAAARRFQRAVVEQRFPKLLDMDQTITISGGLAGYPWDAQSAEQLLAIADEMALQSKSNGKNALTFGPGALRISNGDDHG